MSNPRILVLMTTYNGERYLRQQLDSVLTQEGVEVTLRVRDDCSSDGTWAILQEYAAAHDNVEALRNDPNLGVIRNFMGSVYECDADAYDFFAICDQDDVWHADKLRVAAEKLAPAGQRPGLYYAGINNVDEKGRSLGNEYLPYKVCAENYGSLLLVQNWCLGCTSLMNPALVKLLQEHPVYDFVRMYDAWIHAVALYCGGYVVADLENSYIERRITGGNTVGLMNVKRSPIKLASIAVGWVLHKDTVRADKHTGLARCLLREYADRMDNETQRLVQAVATRETNAASRRYLLSRKDICMQDAAKTQWLRTMIRLNRF